MIKSIVNTDIVNYQPIATRELICVGIQLVSRVVGLMDCNPELESNPHAIKAKELVSKWNELFIDSFLLSREGK